MVEALKFKDKIKNPKQKVPTISFLDQICGTV